MYFQSSHLFLYIVVGPSSPRNLSAKSINSTAVKVTWISSQNPNGEIQYRLFYWQSSEGPGAKRQAYDGPALEHVIAGLHEFVAYTFTLLAYNVKYSWSSPVVNSTETTHPEGKRMLEKKFIGCFEGCMFGCLWYLPLWRRRRSLESYYQARPCKSSKETGTGFNLIQFSSLHLSPKNR